MDGAMNVEDHTFNKADGVTRGVALRAFDSKTGQWAIWWVDSRNPRKRRLRRAPTRRRIRQVSFAAS
jgi:hypothetical protein